MEEKGREKSATLPTHSPWPAAPILPESKRCKLREHAGSCTNFPAPSGISTGTKG
jgi:hypothetical protein